MAFCVPLRFGPRVLKGCCRGMLQRDAGFSLAEVVLLRLCNTAVGWGRGSGNQLNRNKKGRGILLLEEQKPDACRYDQKDPW